ncbi:MAG: TRAM domain-containing protein, partial [Chthoniobacterales bacterium]
MRRGEDIDLEITDTAYGGDGIARHEGRVVFVPFAIPGEKVRARVVDLHRSYARAEIRTVSTPSPARMAPPCPL